MKTIRLFCLLMIFSPGVFFAQNNDTKKEAGLEWHTDLMKAHELSKSTGKPIFAFFTGSDWCGWCKKLQANVFAKAAFVEWAKKNVVLLELDFPRMKQLTPELTQQNQNLQQSFGVRGYPTVWLFFMEKDAVSMKFNIDALGSLGYPQGAEAGKEEIKFLQDGEAVLKNKK
ncbi:MAG: thioredoxin family protein [Bacteroidetes bacterium]|jgi:protein disulfide-isomerase|nr:thioredoxin family protein [Bacteroidota bacterium]